MSDAHLTEHPVDGAPEPVDLVDEPISLGTGDQEATPERRASRARRRRVAWLLAAAVGLAGIGALGSTGWRIVQQKDAEIATPYRVAGLTRDDSEGARSTSDYLRSGLAANVELERSFGTVYRDPANEHRSVLVFGGTTLLWQPERDLDSLFELMNDETGAVTGLRDLPPGRLGGVLKCGTTDGEGGDFAVCGWADHGSVVMAMFPDRSVDDAGSLLRDLRGEMQSRI
ncbi:hypothetical protein QTQ03_12365 [Micromonospora sp. WMMA1363]|uniref:hypothetical protein n=1 Tax=Micromonospora sp. WMMA1363 TaxID=3053985 RepID=UPI00259CF210|nr:hypothetical protein [Micromonospora sp. WMMA1363]MDM4720334.1 hypothetical protein [Micromonospora sp. WMMA1363]